MDEMASRLSQISTMWTVLRQATPGEKKPDPSAQQAVLEMYTPAVYRYLVGAVKDPDLASDLFQEFALRFVRGDFRNIDPERGRFRHFLKRMLFNLVADHFRQKKRQGVATLDMETQEPAAPLEENQENTRFLEHWRSELLSRTWKALETWEKEQDQPFYTVLKCRTEHPEIASGELAERVSQALSKPVNATWVRNRLHFAREKFAELMIAEVRQTVVSADLDSLREELIELGLYTDRCREILDRYSK